MELRQLQYFATIARLKGFRRAADALEMSPSALSEQVRLLERELGVPLLERSKRTVALTEAGEVLLARAERALLEISAAREEVLEFAKVQRGRVVMGVLSPSPSNWLAPLFAEFKQHYPGVEIALVERPTDALLLSVGSGEVHVAWIVGPAEGQHVPDHLAFQHLITYEVHGVVAADHPLAGRGTATLAEIAPESLVVAPPGDPYRLIVERAFRSRGYVPHVAFEAGDPVNVLGLVAAGLGVGFAPSAVIHRSTLPVSDISITDAQLMATGVLTWGERAVRTRAVQTFLDYIRERARERWTDYHPQPPSVS